MLQTAAVQRPRSEVIRPFRKVRLYSFELGLTFAICMGMNGRNAMLTLPMGMQSAWIKVKGIGIVFVKTKLFEFFVALETLFGGRRRKTHHEQPLFPLCRSTGAPRTYPARLCLWAGDYTWQCCYDLAFGR